MHRGAVEVEPVGIVDQAVEDDLRFVTGLVRPRRHHGSVVMRGHVGIGPVDRRFVEAGLGDTDLQIVRDDLARHAAEEPERPPV